MRFGPIIWRELLTAARRQGVFRDRAVTALIVLLLMAGCVAVCDKLGIERESLSGVRMLTQALFVCGASVQAAIVLAMVPGEVAPAVARERDKKTLDALLASSLNGFEVVVGGLAAGLAKALAGLVVVFPLMVVIVPLGGIDPRVVMMVYAGLVSTAFAMGAASVLASVVSKTVRHALGLTVLMMTAWVCVPWFGVMFLGRVWPAAAGWLMPALRLLVGTSPVGLLAGFVLGTGPGSFVAAFWRMIAWELGGGLVLVAVAVRRLRPASRALYDAEGRLLARLMRRRRHGQRPPVGDDPVFWNEKYSTRGVSEWQFVLGRIVGAICLVGLAAGTLVFAVPSVFELLDRGYIASPGGAAGAQTLNPVARLFAGRALSPPPPGFARLEFNKALRLVTLFYLFIHTFSAASMATEGVTTEREKDTWLGLIATPLSGREVLGAKMLGTLWRMRPALGALGVLWLVGLFTGAVHPLGLLAVTLVTVVATWFLVAAGVYISLYARDRNQAMNRVAVPSALLAVSGLLLMALAPPYRSVWVGVASLPLFGDLALLSYDDVGALARNGVLPRLSELEIGAGAGGLTVLIVGSVGLTAQAVAAFLLTRSAFRGFDAAVGRPVRPGSARVASRVSVSRAAPAAVEPC